MFAALRTESRTESEQGARTVAYIGKFRDGWRAQVQKDGIRASKTFALKRDAQAWALAQESRKSLKKSESFASACGRYFETVSSTKRNPAWERRKLDAFEAHFGSDTALAAIDSDTIGRWRDKRLETVSGSTVQREANLLRHLFTLACDEWRWIERNPFRGVRLPKENPPRHQLWTWPLIRRVLRAERTGKTAEVIRAFHISLHTGLRLAEVIAGRYDPARRVIDLERTKTSGRVAVPVTRRAAKVLPWTGTVGANEASVLFSKLCRELLIDGLHFHDARATALTLLARRVDVLTLARISRHKDLKVLLASYYRESAESIAARI